MENIVIRKYREDDLAAMTEIWNEVVEDGIAFPQTEKLDIDGAGFLRGTDLQRIGFRQLGTIPGGFLMKDGHYEDICPYYFDLMTQETG